MSLILPAWGNQLGQPGQIKPSGIPRIDWSHPLANGLISYWWQDGNGYIDLVTSDLMVLTGSTWPPLDSSGYGHGLLFAAGNVSMAGSANARIQNWTVPYGFACGFLQRATPVTPGAWFGVADASGNDAFMLYNDTSTLVLKASFGNAASAFSATIANNTFYVVVGSADTSTSAPCWVNGIAQTTFTSNPAYSGSSLKYCIGSDHVGAAAGSWGGGAIYFGATWNRSLSATEATLLYTNPYCFLLPQEPELPALFVAAGGAAQSLALTPTTYVESGISVSRTLGINAPLAPGTYAESGQPIARTRGINVPLVPGTYAETGQPIFRTRGVNLPLVKGSYLETGAPISLVYTPFTSGQTLNLTPGTYLWTGSALWQVLGRNMPLVNGTYNETGFPLDGQRGVTLPLVRGSYVESGQPVVGTRGTNLPLLSGGYVASGRPISGRRDITAPLVKGGYVLSGQPANLVYGQHVPNPVIVLQPGSYVLSSMPAGLVYVPYVPPGAYNFGVSGKYVACNYGLSGDGTLVKFSNPVYPLAPVEKATDTGGAVVADWTLAFNLPDGTRPAVVLDFINQRYFDGVSNSATLASMVSGSPTVDANGMLCNATTFTGIGALRTALQQSAVTIRAETNLGTNGVIGAIVGFQSPYCPLFEDSTSGNQVGGYNGTSVHGPAPDWTQTAWSATAWNASGRDITANEAGPSSDGGTYPTPTTITIGSTWGTDLFGGYLRTLTVYSLRVSTTMLQYIAGPLPYPPLSGAHSVVIFGASDYVTPGPVLLYERTQSWTSMATIRIGQKPGIAAVMFTNVISAPWYGYEFWIDENGHLRVRIMSNWDGGGGSGLLGVIGSGNVVDSRPHTVVATYDGTSTPAGINFYVDGVLDPGKTTEASTLSTSIISGTPDFWVGNQVSFPFQIGVLDNFVMSNIARSGAYVAANVGVLPAIDAHTVLSYAFEEGSGTTTADGSASGFTGTLKNGATWV